MPFKSYPGGVGVVAASYMRRTCCAIVDHDDDHYLGRLSVRTRLGAATRAQLLCDGFAPNRHVRAGTGRCYAEQRTYPVPLRPNDFARSQPGSGRSKLKLSTSVLDRLT